MKALLQRWLGRFGAEHMPVTHGERFVSAAGGLLALLAVIAISRWLLDAHGSVGVIASMGATAVLIFAVPHGPLSQPWAVFGGHTVSAIVGVACAMWFPDSFLAAPLAVGLAIGAMHYLRCMHPPGGATALTAVIGGEAVQAMGFQFVFTPVLLNAAVMLACGVAFNAPFPWRRYPAWLVPRARPAPEADGLAAADLDWALGQMNSFIDVSEDDLRRLFGLAQQHARSGHLRAEAIVAGGCYSNGLFGEYWQVRKVVHRAGGHPAGGRLIYRVVAGVDRGVSGECTPGEFARWARYRVVRNENSWQRLADSGASPVEQAG